jgi:AraC-like DNA-binding protein
MNMTVSNLSKNFKRDTGMTLKEYFDSQLLRNAKQKLLLSDASVKEIAYSLGFNDEFYFSRFFKKHEGIAPREYRGNNRMRM